MYFLYIKCFIKKYIFYENSSSFKILEQFEELLDRKKKVGVNDLNNFSKTLANGMKCQKQPQFCNI